MNTLYASPAVLIISINDDEQNKPPVILFFKNNYYGFVYIKNTQKIQLKM